MDSSAWTRVGFPNRLDGAGTAGLHGVRCGAGQGCSSMVVTGGADARHLHRLAGDGEALSSTGLRDDGGNARIDQFLGIAAARAHQELPGMEGAGGGAADKGVQAFDAVDQALFQQEIQRTIHGQRRHPFAVGRQILQNGIGAARLMAGPDQFQHARPLCCQAHAAFGAQLIRPDQRIMDAGAMIMCVCSRLHRDDDDYWRMKGIVRSRRLKGDAKIYT